MFNTFANVAGITTPIVIGYIVKATGRFDGAMVFLAANALTTILSYLFIVGEIRRVELKQCSIRKLDLNLPDGEAKR